MSGTTTNLELFKYDPNTDGDQTFNIDNALNNNFDKLDTFAGTVNTALTNLGNGKANTSLDNLNATGQAKFDAKADKDFTYKTFKRLDEGENLATKFATEIANYSTIYDWLSARKTAGNFEGINIGDYFTTSLSAGTIAGYTIAAQSFTCRIIGINTYKNCGDEPIGNMFYIKSDEVIDTPILWNPNNNNNGTGSQNNPWLASAMYTVLNGGNNYAKGYNNVYHGANGGNGIISLLPSALRNVMITKRALLESRYSSSGLLNEGTTWAWGDMGKLWLPNEVEVYGHMVMSHGRSNPSYSNGLSIQFPYFANNCERRISYDSQGNRRGWWLSVPASSNSASVCNVASGGYARSDATYSAVYAPLCFCI